MAQVTGKVKWFDVKKGYGYLTDGNGNDFFAHFSGITEGRTFIGLRDGDEVTFDVVDGKKGKQAADIKMVHRNGKYHAEKSEVTTEEVVEEAAE